MVYCVPSSKIWEFIDRWWRKGRSWNTDERRGNPRSFVNTPNEITDELWFLLPSIIAFLIPTLISVVGSLRMCGHCFYIWYRCGHICNCWWNLGTLRYSNDNRHLYVYGLSKCYFVCLVILILMLLCESIVIAGQRNWTNLWGARLDVEQLWL